MARIDPIAATMVNRALQVNDQSSLGAIGQFGIPYYPSYQKLYLHCVMILRGKQTIDHTASVNTRLLQRETSMESGMYGGATTVQLLLDDVRIDDTLWITYTIEGENPVFGNRWASDFSWDNYAPIELRRLTKLHPRKRAIYWRQLGDFRTEEIKPQIDQIAETERMRFEARGIEAIEDEPNTPSDFLPARLLQFSEYPDWQGVAGWADALFPKGIASAELKQRAQQFGKQATAAAKATARIRAIYWSVCWLSLVSKRAQSCILPVPPRLPPRSSRRRSGLIM